MERSRGKRADAEGNGIEFQDSCEAGALRKYPLEEHFGCREKRETDVKTELALKLWEQESVQHRLDDASPFPVG